MDDNGGRCKNDKRFHGKGPSRINTCLVAMNTLLISSIVQIRGALELIENCISV